jgi:ATP-binding cassette subfamily F protein 3
VLGLLQPLGGNEPFADFSPLFMITLKNVVLRRSAKVLLDSASVTINPGEHVGIVGRNGAGKSTLFALLNGSLHEDSGEYYIPAQWRMAQVAQDMPETDQGATAFVIDGDTTLMAAQKEVEAAEATDDYDRMAHAYTALADCGAYDAPARAQALILGLGFKTTELDNPGQQLFGRLAHALAIGTRIDVPFRFIAAGRTHQPFGFGRAGMARDLVETLRRHDAGDQHDREFLDAVTGVTVQIENAKLNRFGGNYKQV